MLGHVTEQLAGATNDNSFSFPGAPGKPNRQSQAALPRSLVASQCSFSLLPHDMVAGTMRIGGLKLICMPLALREMCVVSCVRVLCCDVPELPIRKDATFLLLITLLIINSSTHQPIPSHADGVSVALEHICHVPHLHHRPLRTTCEPSKVNPAHNGRDGAHNL